MARSMAGVGGEASIPAIPWSSAAALRWGRFSRRGSARGVLGGAQRGSERRCYAADMVRLRRRNRERKNEIERVRERGRGRLLQSLSMRLGGSEDLGAAISTACAATESNFSVAAR
jgi:hypothetical protein